MNYTTEKGATFVRILKSNMNYTADKYGTFVRILPGVLTEDDNATNANVTDRTEEESYDYVGAMHFVVATVLVYSILGVFCVLLSRIKRLRGKHHENYVNDESISKYLKNERTLKTDGRKMKLMYECELISQRVKQFEERQKLLNLEKHLLEAFKNESPVERRHKRKKRKKKRDLGNTLGLMGASLFYLDSASGSYSSLDSQYLPSVAEDIETDGTDDKSEHSYVTCHHNNSDVAEKRVDIYLNGSDTDLLLHKNKTTLYENTVTENEREMLINFARDAKSVAHKDSPLITGRVDSRIPGITIFDENGQIISDEYAPSSKI